MKTLKVIGMVFFALLVAAGAFANEINAAQNAVSIDTVWMLIAAFLVFFMQAGFAMVEAGFTRAKNASNILMKNLMDFAMGSLAYWAVGFALMFGKDLWGFIGTSGFFLSGGDPFTAEGLWQLAFWMFQVVFAATAATIVSGAMAERTKFIAYLLYSAVISAVIYPVVGHWIWGGGWLGNLGMVDFAGSTVVHSVGGWAGLVGAIMLGPRMGKYVEAGGMRKVRAIPGHNLPIAALGVFILWFAWFGFNAGSTTSGTNPSIGTIAVTTNLSAAAGAFTSMIYSWIRFKKPDPSMSLNGALAGLVAITAGCAAVSPTSAVIIGLVSGVLVVLAVQFFDKVLYIDDPVGAVSVHGVCGAFGTLMVGLFAQAEYAESAGIGTINGLFYGGGWSLLGVQATGVGATFVWVSIACLGLFSLIRKTVGLRVDKDEELRGLDIEEHGVEAYNGFQIFTTQ
ncbi:MAG: ammonium transporter [Spirochaetes bacterium]|nr:ammonium transporter [Spirochaetota bacterium]